MIEASIKHLPDINLRHEEYGYAPPVFGFKEQVWHVSDYDKYFAKAAENSKTVLPDIYEIISIKIVEHLKDGKLQDHPYWLYEIRHLNDKSTLSVKRA